MGGVFCSLLLPGRVVFGLFMRSMLLVQTSIPQIGNSGSVSF